MTKRPTRYRLILVGAAIIAAIAGAAGLIIEMQRRASIDAFMTATSNLCNGMSQQTMQTLAAADRALSEIGTVLTSVPNITTEQIQAELPLKSTFDLLLEKQKPLPVVDSLGLADADGRIVSTSTGWPSVPANVSGRDFFAHFQADDDHAAFVGMPVLDPGNGKWSAIMARRIDDAHGELAGIVLAKISLTTLQDFYRVAMPGHRSVYLLRRDGVVLVRFPPSEHEIGKTVPAQSPWYATLAEAGGAYNGPGFFDPSRIIAASQPLRNLPFVVQTSVSEADALSEWQRQRVFIVSGSIAAAAYAVALLGLFAVQYRRLELSELSLAAKNAELDAAHGHLDATLANLSQGVCFYDQDQKLLFSNRRYCELYGLSTEAIKPGIALWQVAKLRVAAGSFSDQPIAEYLSFIDQLVRGGKVDDRIVHLSDGRTMLSHLQPLPGRGWVSTHEDITLRHEAESKIVFLARHDTLTGLANRTLFRESLERALVLAQRGKGFALLCLDLDGFKAVNDTHGHAIGDALLRGVAARLLDAVRDGDTVARLGGDEFAIIQIGVSEVAEATAFARRVMHSINPPFELEGHQVRVGTSIGIAMAPGDSVHPAQLMKNADLALYRAKKEGRGTWRFFEPAMDAVARMRRALEADLRTAVSSGELELHYQPMVCAPDRTVTGFEALLRWRHPTRGLVMPCEFIPVADEIGLIVEIGALVLRQACAEAATWPDHLRVAINLSTRQVRDPTLLTTVLDAIRTAGIAPERVEFEITESLPSREDETMMATLHDLHALGARIALDDFGTGYSSLSYLRGFPFSTIKIDRSFVSDLRTRDTGIGIIRGIIGLAANLRMSVTAEGVETEAQFEFLAGAGCNEIQGHLISRPVPAHEIPALIERLSGPKASLAPLFTLGSGSFGLIA